MSESDNTKLAKTFFDNLNARALDKNDALQVADAKTEAPGAPGLASREQSRAYVQGFITAFPDLHFDVQRTVAQGDYVVLNWIGTGTHTGPLTTPSGAKVPPTGKKTSVPGSTTYEIKGGMVTHTWIYWDMASLLGQLGLLPPM